MLQRVLNGTARVIFGGDSRHHVTPLLHDHLPTGVQGNPRPGTMLSQRTVHPSFDCSQLFYYRSVSWNSLPLDIRCTPALSTFKNMLKIHLFTSLTDCVTECEQRTLYGALVVTSHVTVQIVILLLLLLLLLLLCTSISRMHTNFVNKAYGVPGPQLWSSLHARAQTARSQTVAKYVPIWPAEIELSMNGCLTVMSAKYSYLLIYRIHSF